jgi:hypothetical protein
MELPSFSPAIPARERVLGGGPVQTASANLNQPAPEEYNETALETTVLSPEDSANGVQPLGSASVEPVDLLFPDISTPAPASTPASVSTPASAPASAPAPAATPTPAQITSQAPSLAEVAKGGLLTEGQQGQSVEELKKLLAKAGYPSKPGNVFDAELKATLGKYQVAEGLLAADSPNKGQLGPQTLKDLQKTSNWGDYALQKGKSLAEDARRNISGGVGKCYKFVANAIDSRVGRFLTGDYAYQAASQLAKSPHFKEVKVSGSDLKKLPAGAVVVWDRAPNRADRNRGDGWTAGHISIADGKGNEISDHVAPQMTSHYAGGKARVFLPVNRA